MRPSASASTAGDGSAALDSTPPARPVDPLDCDAELDALVDNIVEAVEPHRVLGAALVAVDLTARGGRDACALVSALRDASDHTWAVTSRVWAGGGEHVHALAVFESEREARAWLRTLTASRRLSRAAQRTRELTRWRSGIPTAWHSDVWYLARYCLKVLAKAGDRRREGPVAVDSWGDLAGARELSRFALCAAAVTRRCERCGKSLLPGQRADSAYCRGGACKQAAHRARPTLAAVLARHPARGCQATPADALEALADALDVEGGERAEPCVDTAAWLLGRRSLATSPTTMWRALTWAHAVAEG